MNDNNMPRRAARVLSVAVLAAWAATAGAQSSPPWYVAPQLSVTKDSNVFRTNTGEISDTIASFGVLGGVDIPFGRQAFVADVLVRRDEFRDQNQLDNTAYRFGARLDWATIERLSGTVDVSSRKELARNDLLATTGDNARTTQRIDNATVSARLGATSVLAIQGRLGHQNVDYDTNSALIDYESLDYRQNFASLGLVYRPSGLLTLGIAARGTKGKYHNSVPEDEYDRKDLDLTATWVPTGISRVIARLSKTDEEHDVQTQRDVSGVTGAVQWDWRPTGKLRFLSDMSRDTGSQVAFSQALLPTGEILTATAPDSRVVASIGTRAFYDLTAKISLNAELRSTDRDFDVQADDRTNLISIGARWEPTRAVSLGCALSKQSRNSPVVEREFDANVVSCFGRFTLQG
jgi:Putative beta-barrel porin 2